MMNMHAYIHTSQFLLIAAYPDLNVDFKGPSICEPMGNINEVSSHPQALSPFPSQHPFYTPPEFFASFSVWRPAGGQMQLTLVGRLCGNHPAWPRQ